MLNDDVCILVVGVGIGKEIIELVVLKLSW